MPPFPLTFSLFPIVQSYVMGVLCPSTVRYAVKDMWESERVYGEDLAFALDTYHKAFQKEQLPEALEGKKDIIFSSLPEIGDFHQKYKLLTNQRVCFHIIHTYFGLDEIMLMLFLGQTCPAVTFHKISKYQKESKYQSTHLCNLVYNTSSSIVVLYKIVHISECYSIKTYRS